MVLDDADLVERTLPLAKRLPIEAPADWQERLATPVDRFAAFIADCLFMAPALTLVLAPFRREAMRAQLISSREGWTIAAAAALGAVVLGFIAYHAVFVACMGSTPGKKLFGLRIVSIWTNRKPRVGAALARAWSLAVEVGLCGLPWLAAYSNERRRTLHDRIADTVVIADKGRAHSALPTPAEAGAAAGVFAAAMAVVAAVGLVAIDEASRNVREGEREARELEDRGLLCSAVADFRAEFPLESRPSRLEAALALEAAGRVDSACLLKESQREAWSNTQGRALAYAAGAVARKGQASALRYAEKACEGSAKSAVCLIARLAIGVDGERATIDSELERLPDTANIVYLQATMVREAMEQRQWRKALTLVEQPSPQSGLASFYAAVRARSLWAVGREAEARAAWGVMLPVLRGTEHREFALQACSTQTTRGCSEDARRACADFASFARADANVLKEADAVVAYIRGHECSFEKPDFSWTKKAVMTAQSRAYAEAVGASLKATSVAEGIIPLRKFLESQTTGEDALWFDVQTRIARLAGSLDDLENIRGEWEKYSASDSTLALGRALASRFIDLGAPQRALETALALREQDPQAAESARAVVAAAFSTGDLKLAEASLAALADLAHSSDDRTDLSADVRTPASIGADNDFVRAARALRARAVRARRAAP